MCARNEFRRATPRRAPGPSSNDMDPMQHWCRYGDTSGTPVSLWSSRRYRPSRVVRLWGLLLHQRCSTGAVRAPVAGRMLFSMRKPGPDGNRASRRTPSRTPLHCASHVLRVPRPAPLGHHGPRLTYQPRPAPHPANHGPHLTPLTAFDRQPFGCLLSTRSQTAAYFSPSWKRAQYQGAQHVGHQASRGHHRPR